MAQVTFVRPANMQAAFAFYGVVREAGAGRIVVGNGYATTVYEGSFTFSDEMTAKVVPHLSDQIAFL